MKPSNQTLRSIVISTALICAVLLQYCEAGGSRGRSSRSRSSSRRQSKHKDQLESRRERKPNIILVMSDDQDVVLGSMSAMNKTKRLLGEKGANFINAFVTTPLCCPSRSSILTGQYVHNHHVYSNQDHCVSDEWKAGPERRSFGAFLQNANYRTGYFGKYLNRYDGSYVPNGWMEWVGLIQNSKFYNYTLNRNGQLFNHGHDYHRDYLPDLIANDSTTFFKLSKMAYPDNPIHMVLSFPGPHGPEDGAPQYAHMFEGNQLHRTPAWNHSPNHDKHWLMQYTSALSEQHKIFTNYLQRKRLITLMSIDDAVEKLCNTLDELGELDNTYIIYTSDHGYHLGQYGMVKGKSNPYDFDTRVPFYIRGPKIPQGIEVPNIALNIDLAPTILNLAGIPVPPYMDGTSIIKLFDPPTNYRLNKRKKYRYVGNEPWRDSFLVERTRSPAEWEQYFRRLEKERGTPGPKKQSLIEDECHLPELQTPCKPGQVKFCDIEEGTGEVRIRKCRELAREERERQREPKCKCKKIRTGHKNEEQKGGNKGRSAMTRAEKRQQRVFLRDHTNQADQRHRFLRARRDVAQEIEDLSDFEGSYDLQFELSQLGAIVGDTKCQVLTNDTVVCDEEVLSSKKTLVQHKKRIDEQLRLLREQMKNLQEIKLYLKRSRPDNDNLESATKETHVCTCEGGLSYTENEEFLADDPAEQETVAVVEEVVLEDDTQLDENRRDRDKKDKKKKEDRRRNRQKRRAHFDDEFANEAEPFFQENLVEEDRVYDIRDTKESQTLTLMERRKLRKAEKKKGKSKKECSLDGMNCFSHDNDHWRTPPYWTLGNICVCSNTINNSYSCVRTINETHDLLYCEFITKFLEFYDMRPEVDPHQTINGIYNLSDGERRHLTNQVHDLKNCAGYSQCTAELSPHYKAIGHERYGSDGMVNVISGSGSGEADIADETNIFTTTTTVSSDIQQTTKMPEDSPVTPLDDIAISGSGDSDDYQKNADVTESVERQSFLDDLISGSGEGYTETGSGQKTFNDAFISGSGSSHKYQEIGSGEIHDTFYPEIELDMSFSGSGGREVAEYQKEQDKDLNFETTAIPLPSVATFARKVLRALTSGQRTLPSGQSTSARNMQGTLPPAMNTMSSEQTKKQSFQVLTNSDDFFETTSSFSPTAATETLVSQANPGEMINIHDSMNIHEDVNIHKEETNLHSNYNNVSTKFEWIVAKSNVKVSSSDLSLILGDGFLLDLSTLVKTTHSKDGGRKINLIELLRRLSKRVSTQQTPMDTPKGTTEGTTSMETTQNASMSPSKLTTPRFPMTVSQWAPTSRQGLVESDLSSTTQLSTEGTPLRNSQEILTTIPTSNLWQTTQSTPTHSPQHSPYFITTPPSPITMVTITKDTLDNSIDPVLFSTKRPQLAASFPAPVITHAYNGARTEPSHGNAKDGYGSSQSNKVEVTESSQVKGHSSVSLNGIGNNVLATVKSDTILSLTTHHVTNNHVENEKVKGHEEIAKGSKKFRKRKMRKKLMKEKHNHVEKPAVMIEGSGINIAGQSSNDSESNIHVTMDTDFIMDQIFPV